MPVAVETTIAGIPATRVAATPPSDRSSGFNGIRLLRTTTAAGPSSTNPAYRLVTSVAIASPPAVAASACPRNSPDPGGAHRHRPQSGETPAERHPPSAP